MLTITHDGTTRVIEAGELTFGRTASLVIGPTNQFVHRVVGRFVAQDGVWWLENRAEHLPVTLVNADGSRVELPARSTSSGPAVAAIVGPDFRVSFAAGGVVYLIEGEIGGPIALPDPGSTLGTGTETIHTIVLTDEERQMLEAMARPVLAATTPGPDAIPANKVLARQLGWPDTKLNRKLDYLCTRLTKQGFQGLKGDLGGEAKLRRWRLVEYAISHGVVTPEDDAAPSA